MTSHSSPPQQTGPEKRRWVGTTRGLMVVVAGVAIACFTLVQIRGCHLGRASTHGPRYHWNFYLSSLEDRVFFEHLAADADEKAAREKGMAAKAPNPAEREEHEARAESWAEKASFYRSEAASTVRSARVHLDNYKESLRQARASKTSR